jgi:hypothetical protein
MLTKSKTDADEPRRPKERMESVDPTLIISIIESAEPHRTKLRTDNEDAYSEAFRTLKLMREPKRTKEWTEIEDPKRAYDRILIVDPNVACSSAENESPKRKAPLTLKLLPKLQVAIMESE